MKTNSISYILLLICIVVCFVGCQSTDTTRQESSTIDEDNRCYYDVERYISDEIDEEIESIEYDVDHYNVYTSNGNYYRVVSVGGSYTIYDTNGNIYNVYDHGNGASMTFCPNGDIYNTHDNGNGSSMTFGPNGEIYNTYDNGYGSSMTFGPDGEFYNTYDNEPKSGVNFRTCCVSVFTELW